MKLLSLKVDKAEFYLFIYFILFFSQNGHIE